MGMKHEGLTAKMQKTNWWDWMRHFLKELQLDCCCKSESTTGDDEGGALFSLPRVRPCRVLLSVSFCVSLRWLYVFICNNGKKKRHCWLIGQWECLVCRQRRAVAVTLWGEPLRVGYRNQSLLLPVDPVNDYPKLWCVNRRSLRTTGLRAVCMFVHQSQHKCRTS